MDSIIFDLDGTLWDSVDVVLDAWNQALQESGAETTLTKEDLRGVMGLQAHEIRDKLFPHLTDQQHQKFTELSMEFESAYVRERGGQLFEDVEHVLGQLSQKYNLYIVSNCQDGYIESFYAYHQLDEHFVDFENPGRTGLSKGENIQLVMERNNVERAVYVGDTRGDHKAAKAAGIPFVYAAYGFGDVEDYDYVIDEFKELLKLFG